MLSSPQNHPLNFILNALLSVTQNMAVSSLLGQGIPISIHANFSVWNPSVTDHCPRGEIRALGHGGQASGWPALSCLEGLSSLPPHLQFHASVILSCVDVQAAIRTSLLGPCFLSREGHSPFLSNMLLFILQVSVSVCLLQYTVPGFTPFHPLDWIRCLCDPLIPSASSSLAIDYCLGGFGIAPSKNYLLICLPRETMLFEDWHKAWSI